MFILLSSNFIWLCMKQISQVNRAETADGVDVVVKVQHKGIKDVILQV